MRTLVSSGFVSEKRAKQPPLEQTNNTRGNRDNTAIVILSLGALILALLPSLFNFKGVFSSREHVQYMVCCLTDVLRNSGVRHKIVYRHNRTASLFSVVNRSEGICGRGLDQRTLTDCWHPTHVLMGIEFKERRL